MLEKAFPNPGFYGWKIVLLGFLACALSSPGQTFVISLYLEPLMEMLGLERVAISSVYAVATLLAALTLPLVGYLADKVSSRLFFVIVFAGMGLALLGLPFVTGVLTLGLAIYILRMLGQGSIAIGSIRTTALWFDQHRGRAIAIVGLGFAFGELVFPGIVQGLIRWLGWRESLLFFAVLYLVLVAPLISLPMRDPPASTAEEKPASSPRETTEATAAIPIIMSVPFWILVIGVSLVPFALTALIFHQVALVESYGWRVELIPAIFAAFALLRIGSSYASGLLFERLPSMWNITLSGVFVALACGTVVLPLPAMVMALAYGSLLGVAAGISTAGNAILWPERYGVAVLGRLQGTVNAVRNGSTAAAPLAAAWLASATESFLAIPLGIAIAALLAGVLPFIVWRMDRVRLARLAGVPT